MSQDLIDCRDHHERVFVNRSLSNENINFFGFDMDYTLAVYKSPAYEALAFRLIIDQLCEQGYPSELKSFDYDPTFPVRGLFFDKLYGNLLKVDTYGNILLCIHGFDFVIGEELKTIYPNKFVQFDVVRHQVYNTLFALPEMYALACIINLFEKQMPEFSREKEGIVTSDVFMSYKSICQDVRHAVDYIHIQSGKLKSETMKNPGMYIAKDIRVPKLLQRMRKAGKKTFLLTNSDYTYTRDVMTFLCDFKGEDDEGVGPINWKELFDFILVDARKPLFFGEGTTLRKVNEETGQLRIGHYTGKHTEGVIYSGGNSEVFSELIGAEGKDILFIGDHIFGDILKSKKQEGWRTYLVVPELSQELDVWTKQQTKFFQLSEYECELANKYKDLDSRNMDKIDITEIKKNIKRVTHDLERCYGKLGSLFRSGSRQTFFASQCLRYADLYATSCVSLLYYPFSYLFRAPYQLMPHESTVEHETTNKEYGPLENARMNLPATNGHTNGASVEENGDCNGSIEDDVDFA